MAGRLRILVLAVSIVSAWLLLGTLVYKLAENCDSADSCSATPPSCGWSWQESFYYSVQAGLSIGFGLLPENKEGSQLYTVFHIMMGSSVIGGALSLLVSVSVARNRDYRDKTQEALRCYSLTMATEGYSGFTVNELRRLMAKHPSLYHDILSKTESDEGLVSQKMQKFSSKSERARGPMIDELLEDALEKVEEMNGGKLSIADLRKIHLEERSLSTKVKVMVKQHLMVISVFSFLGLWILVGIIFGLCAEEWSFITSLYFSIASMSTAGLKSVTRTPDGWHVLFAGMYSLVGVPLYGAALGTFASLLSDRYGRKEFDDALNAKMGLQEVAFVEHLVAAEQTETLSLAEFTEIETLRLGLVDRDTLRQIRDKFRKLDKENTGSVRTRDCLAADQKIIARVKKNQEAAQSGDQHQAPQSV